MMRTEVVERLLALNRAFYDQLAAPFACSRKHPQPGFFALLDQLPRPCSRFLDVGCGEGRLGRFLQANSMAEAYTGIDSSSLLLAEAAKGVTGEFFCRDISRPFWSSGLGSFDGIACLAVLQHIPARANRIRLLREMGARLTPHGRLFLSTWQFMEQERFRRKTKPWQEIGLAADDVEQNDYLLTWEREQFALRYVSYIDEAEMGKLLSEAGLQAAATYRSDGKEGDLNLYLIAEPD